MYEHIYIKYVPSCFRQCVNKAKELSRIKGTVIYIIRDSIRGFYILSNRDSIQDSEDILKIFEHGKEIMF